MADAPTTLDPTVSIPAIQPGMTQDQLNQALQQAMMNTLQSTNETLKANQQLLAARRAELFGNQSDSGNLSPQQAKDLLMLKQMIHQNPIIIEPLMMYGAVLVKANSENNAAIMANPSIIIDFNKWLRSTGKIQDPGAQAQTPSAAGAQ